MRDKLSFQCFSFIFETGTAQVREGEKERETRSKVRSVLSESHKYKLYKLKCVYLLYLAVGYHSMLKPNIGGKISFKNFFFKMLSPSIALR